MNKANIELDIFSGRRNLEWDVDFEQAFKWYQTAMRLPQTQASKRFEGLGYRGFILRLEQQDGPHILCFVRSDRIEIVKGDAVDYRKDMNSQMETILLESSKTKLDSDLYENLRKQIIGQK